MISAKYKILNTSHESGQSLVEMVIAIGIILTGLIGALALTISNLTGSAEAGTRVVATNLAKEAVEVARNIRDTNWLKDNAWDDGLFSGTDFSAIAVFDTATGQWSLDFSPNAVSDEAAKLYLSSDNLYLQDTSPPAGNPTIYSRLISLYPVCFNEGTRTETSNGGPCAVGEVKIGIRAVAEVKWTESGRARDLMVEDKFYNWH